MKVAHLLFLLASTSQVPAGDPTVPIEAIAQRLRIDSPASTTVEARAELPVIKLKAQVMSNRDRGIAIVEIDGRQTTIRLERSACVSTNQPVHSSSCPSRIQVNGIDYYLADFYDRKIVLSDQKVTFVIQK